MKRWHEDYKITLREWKKHRQSHVENNINNSKNRIGLDPNEVDCHCDEQKGRFRKIDAHDCGNPQCYICHNDKIFKTKTKKQKQSDEFFRDQIRDLNG